MKQIFLPVAALLLTSLSGCAKFLDKFSKVPEGYTKVQFSDGRRNLAAAVDGGLIVYAIRQDAPFRAALKLNSEADTTSFTLPNGQYEFLAVGWPTAGMTGIPKCGKDNSALPIALNGGNGVVTVGITVNNTDCDAAPFTDTAIQSAGLSPATLIFCATDSATLAGKAYVDKCLQHESARFLKPGAALGTGTVEGYTDYDSVSGRMLFMSDQYVDERFDLYSVRSDGTGMVRQNNALASNRNVYDFVVVPGTGKVFYAADEEVDAEYDLYVSTVGTRGGTKVGDVCAGCSGVDFIKPTPYGSKLIVAGDIETVGIKELYMVDLTATGAGIESDCINPPSVNGDLASHSFEVPLGLAGVSGPLAVAIEIYPNTDDCAGTPQRIVFPYGLANPAASTSPSSVKLTASGGFVRYYLND